MHFLIEVQTAIFKEFRLRNLNNVIEWKKSDKIKERYNKLYDENTNAIEKILVSCLK
jgi:hypothetical protein